MNQTLLLIVAAIAIYILFFVKKERYGILMDNACQSGDCSTPEGRTLAEAKCRSDVEKQSFYAILKRECEHPDPEIRKYGCPEPCIASESLFINPSKPSCIPGTRRKGRDSLYYCKTAGDMYILDPTQTEEAFMFRRARRNRRNRRRCC
jgi:hypothetical protein